MRVFVAAVVLALGCGVPRSGVGPGSSDGGRCIPGTSDGCNGRDDDCDGNVDEDELGRECGTAVGVCALGTETCTAGVWGACEGSTGPGVEACSNGTDDDCDGNIDEECACTPGAMMPCGDSDIGACSFGVQTCQSDSQWGTCQGAVSPSTETCNDADDDCDGMTDESVRQIAYLDADMDGFGTVTMSTEGCTAPEGYVTNAGDCNDADSAVRPGATETCDGADQDCDGTTDEGVSTVYFRDADGDGFGDATDTTNGCDTPPPGYVVSSDDCDDDCRLCFPGLGQELCGDGRDNDCDGAAESGSCDCTVVTAGSATYVACTQSVNWSTARAACQRLPGGDLAFPTTSAENTAMITALAALGARDYWVGGTDRDDEGTWKRLDGTTFTVCDFWGDCSCRNGDCNWNGGEPNNSSGEDCMEMVADGRWNDLDCDDDNAFLCEL